jgi:hopanoid biosynthesis associated protein HpnK
MVGTEATQDAVNRARRLPSFRVGLHLVLVNGKPTLPPHVIPKLVDSGGEFSPHLFRAGMNYFFRPNVRKQLEQEIRAQFQAFQETGLALDHVNCHNHMHLHPTIGGLILKVGREYNLRAVRYPYEPFLPSWRASRKAPGRRLMSGILLRPWLALLKSQLQRAGVPSNHFIFGMNDSGRMKLDLVLRFLQELPSGITEIYFHPASGGFPAMDPMSERCGSQEELALLKSPALRQALRSNDIHCISFRDL